MTVVDVDMCMTPKHYMYGDVCIIEVFTDLCEVFTVLNFLDFKISVWISISLAVRRSLNSKFVYNFFNVIGSPELALDPGDS